MRPRNHRVMVGISRHSQVVDNKEPRVNHRHERALHKIKVTHTSRFVLCTRAVVGGQTTGDARKEWEQSCHLRLPRFTSFVKIQAYVISENEIYF